MNMLLKIRKKVTTKKYNKITSQVCKNKENLLNILNSLFSKI